MDYCYWDLPIEELFMRLGTSPEGLSPTEAKKRFKEVGPNTVQAKKARGVFSLLLSQFTSPFILLLLGAALLSFLVGGKSDTLIISLIVVLSGLLGFIQENGANNAVKRLLKMVQINARVERKGVRRKVSVRELVPGDIVFLEAGDVIPADLRIIEEKDLFVDEAMLTGETFGVEKRAGIVSAAAPLKERSCVLFMGSHVISGHAKAVVVETGARTLFGALSTRIAMNPPETSFERGIKQFGYLLMQVTLVLVMTIFLFNILFHRPILESFLFSLALAIGLTPQLLPAIISVCLAYGAKKMAQRNVIVKRLSSIENFGSMEILCSDKTGTLTRGVVELYAAMDIYGNESGKSYLYAYINSEFQLGLSNPVDAAIKHHKKFDLHTWTKLDEIPFDFIRRRTSVLAKESGTPLLITKGAYHEMIHICSQVELPNGERVPFEEVREQLEKLVSTWSEKGFRILALAVREHASTTITYDDEKELTIIGLLVFYDPPKPHVEGHIQELNRLGIDLKILTGDNKTVSHFIADKIGLAPKVITGAEIAALDERALIAIVEEYNVYAEVEPSQKERILLALKKRQRTVGYLGDGINDVTALHAADVGISVDSAVDVAKEVADIVLLKKDLSVLLEGVKDGRRTFANTMKYILMATSANFGNMFSMMGASLFLSFLPLLPKQILLTNLLTDFSEMTIASDQIDPEMAKRPWKWNLPFIRKFMMVFGLISSIFDFMTFGVLLFILKANREQFRTGWFIESVVSASLIILFIRTRKPFFMSRPSPHLLGTVLAVIVCTILLPYTPLGEPLGLNTHLPAVFFLCLAGILVLYIGTIEIVKLLFFRRSLST